jgi:L-amino acid N-acyltransferase YncA
VPVIVRPARPEDAAAVARIYNEGIEDRVATFETEPRGPEDMAVRIGDEAQPLLVAERDGEVLGWASVVRSSDRCAYAGVGEYTVYVGRDARGSGAGRALLEGLVEVAEERAYWKLVGKLFTSNEASIALARRCGFREVGVHRRHGRLDGAWRDVLVVERLLGEAAG